VTVVDIHALHDSANDSSSCIVERIFREKQETGREPLRLIMLDELNKFCPDHGRSPLRELLIDIAERGRSMGVLLLVPSSTLGALTPPSSAMPQSRLWVASMQETSMPTASCLPRCVNERPFSYLVPWCCTSRSSQPLFPYASVSPIRDCRRGSIACTGRPNDIDHSTYGSWLMAQGVRAFAYSTRATGIWESNWVPNHGERTIR